MAKSATERLAEAAQEPEVQRVAAAAAALTGVAATGRLLVDRGRRRRHDARRFRLRRGEPLAQGVRRVARGRIDDALDHLQGVGGGEDQAEAVHAARKSLKRARAVLRLARDELGDDVYRRENAAYRDAGRRLAAARDADVMIDTLEAVTGAAGGEGHRNGDAGLRARLEGERERARAALEADESERREAVAALEDARARIDDWHLDDDVAPLAAGLRRIYRRGRRRMRAAREEPTDERLHEWRKRAKDLWHGYELLDRAQPRAMRARARDAHRLAELLGEDHDLAVLRERVVDHDLRAVIDRRRGALRAEAFELGARVYRRKPRKLATRIARRWRRRAASPA